MKDILLISQDSRFQSASKSYLDQNGDFNIILESDPEKIVDVLQWTDFDAIVCEHSESIDAIGLVTALRENEIDTPYILVYDPHLSEEMLPRGLEAGADYVFKKMAIPSMNARSLLRMLEIAIESHMQLHTALAVGEQYRKVVENANALIVMLDRQDRVRFINRSCLELTGYQWDEVLGRPAIGRIFPVQTSDGKDVKVLLHGKKNAPNEGMEVLELLGRDGSLHVVSWRHTVTEDAEGSCLLSVGVPAAMMHRSLPVQNPFRLLDHISEAFYSMDTKLRVQYLNAEAERILHRSRDEVLGRSIFEIFPNLEGSEFQNRLLLAVKDQRSVKFESRLGTDVHDEWYHVRIYPQADHYSVFFAVITERKKAEAALKESEARYRDFLDQAYEGIVIVDNKGDIQFVNKKIAEIIGAPVEMMIGQNVANILIGEELKLFRHIMALGDQITKQSFDYHYTHPSGKQYWVMITLSPRRDENGKFQGITVMVSDITQTRLDREKLHLQSRVLDQMKDGVIVVGPDFKVIYCNSYVTEIFGWTADEMLGKVPIDIFPADPSKYDMNFLATVGNTPKIEFEESLVSKDGRIFQGLVTLTSLMDGDGNIIGVIGVVRDITQSRAMEKALEVASQKLSLVSRITRHDLRNQLTALTGNLELAARTSSGTKGEKYLAKAIETTKKLSDLIEFTKDYESLGTNEASWMSAETLCRQGFSKVDLGSIDVNIMVRDLELFVDPMLEKVFHNLADNSVRHGGKVTQIEISYRNEGRDVVLAYSDDGEGIPQNKKELILSEESSRHGMRLVREILRINGMEISEVGRYHEGVRFEITVPDGRYRIRDPSF